MSIITSDTCVMNYEARYKVTRKSPDGVPACDTCEKKDVCKFKDTYMSFYKSNKDKIDETPNKEFKTSIKIICDHYVNISSEYIYSSPMVVPTVVNDKTWIEPPVITCDTKTDQVNN